MVLLHQYNKAVDTNKGEIIQNRYLTKNSKYFDDNRGRWSLA